MRAAHGISVQPNGTQSSTIPVTRVPLPLPKGQQTLVPGYGQNGQYMILAKHIQPQINQAKGEKYYYYYHTITRSYYALVQDVTGTHYADHKGNTQQVADQGHFVDLVSGDEYYVNGQPRMEPTTVSYAIEQRGKEKFVDASKPLFIWGKPNNAQGGQSLSVMANIGNQGYSQYLYIPYSCIHKLHNANNTETMELGYKTTGQGASAQVIPMRVLYSEGTAGQSRTEELSVPKGVDTSGMTPGQIAEIAYTAALEQASQSGWALYQINYSISSSGMQYNPITLTEISGVNPKRYYIGRTEYIQGGINGFNYPLAQRSPLNEAIVQGRPFVSEGMGNRSAAENTPVGIPTGTAAFGTTMCGIMDTKADAMLGFIPTIQSGFYTVAQGLPKPGQMAPYQSGENKALGLVTDYSLTGQKSASGVATQSSYIALQSNSQEQAIYSFGYSYASNQKLKTLKSTVNIFANAEGHIALVPQIDSRSRTNVQVPAGSIGSQYLLGFTSPYPFILYQIPPLEVVEQYLSQDKTSYDAGDGSMQNAVTLFKNSVASFGVGMFVDYATGAVFKTKPGDSNYLYPVGYSVSLQGLALIRKQFKGATAKPGSLQLSIAGSPSLPGTQQAPTVPTRSRVRGPVSRTQQMPSEQVQSARGQAPAAPGLQMPQQPIKEAFLDLGSRVNNIFKIMMGRLVI